MNYMPKKKMLAVSGRRGFTLVEVLISASILAIAVFSLAELFVYCSALSDSAGNMSLASGEAQSKMEEIKNTSYSLITTNYASGGTPGNIFAITQPAGRGVVYLDTSTSGLIRVDVTVCWRNASGRVVGEDQNLDGVVGVSEDKNANGKIDSPVLLTSYIAQH